MNISRWSLIGLAVLGLASPARPDMPLLREEVYSAVKQLGAEPELLAPALASITEEAAAGRVRWRVDPRRDGEPGRLRRGDEGRETARPLRRGGGEGVHTIKGHPYDARAVGDFVMCKVREVTETGDVDVGEVRRLPKGKLVSFPTAKVPRLLGRQSSMINMIKEKVGDVLVGKNGYVWISEKADIPLAMDTIKIIEEEAHFPGLTDRISAYLGSAKKVE